MKPLSCPSCGTPSPPDWLITPMGIQYGTGKCGSNWPALILWQCQGAKEIDEELLRYYGVITRAPFTCRTTRAFRWNEVSHHLRHAATQAEVLRLAMDGMI